MLNDSQESRIKKFLLKAYPNIEFLNNDTVNPQSDSAFHYNGKLINDPDISVTVKKQQNSYHVDIYHTFDDNKRTLISKATHKNIEHREDPL